MNFNDKNHLTTELAEKTKQDWSDEGIDPDVSLAASARLFVLYCQDCNINQQQFMYICQGMADLNNWREDTNEETGILSEEGRESGDASGKREHQEAEL